MLLTNDNDYFAEGSFEGLIAKEKKGSMGFGYDPIFIVPKKGRHLAELNEKDKNAISHRALAFNKLLGLL
jgi:XTP/dITP diphosphohydrolase